MADLNALIAQGAQFRVPPPVDPMGNMPQLMQMRAAQNQNALAQYQLGAAQRTDEQQSALNALARNPNFNPNTPEGMRQAQQFGAPGYALVKSAREASSAGVTQDQARANLLKEKMAMLPDAYRMADTPEAYAQLQESIHADPVIGPWLNSIGATREKGVAALQDALAKPNGFAQLRMGSMQSVKDILEGNKPLVVAAGSSVYNPTTQSFVGTAPEKTPTYAPSPDQQGYDVSRAQGYKGTFLDYKKELALAGRAPAQPRAESAPVPVVDPVTGKRILVSRDEAISKRMTPAAAQESLAPQEIQKREAALPQATAAIKATEDNTDKLIAQMEVLRAHPGLSGITGLIAGRTPALTKDARAAQALLENITSKGTLGVLTALRAASKTGGALGNTSNKDVELLKSGFGALNPTQNTSDFQKQMGEVISDLQATKARSREAYTDTYSYKSGGPATAPKEVDFGSLK